MKVRDIRKRAKSKYVVREGLKLLRDSQVTQCKTYTAGCPVCDGWRFYRENGRFVYNFEELAEFMEKTEQEGMA